MCGNNKCFFFERLRSRAILKKNALVKGNVALVYHLSVWVHSCHTDWKTLIHGLVFWQVCLSICTCQEGGQGGTSNRRLHGEVLDHHTLDSSTPTIPVSHVCVCVQLAWRVPGALWKLWMCCAVQTSSVDTCSSCVIITYLVHFCHDCLILNKVHHSSRSV